MVTRQSLSLPTAGARRYTRPHRGNRSSHPQLPPLKSCATASMAASPGHPGAVGPDAGIRALGPRQLGTRASLLPPRGSRGGRGRSLRTYRPSAVDDGRHGGQGVGVPFQAVVSPLGEWRKRMRNTRGEGVRNKLAPDTRAHHIEHSLGSLHPTHPEQSSKGLDERNPSPYPTEYA